MNARIRWFTSFALLLLLAQGHAQSDAGLQASAIAADRAQVIKQVQDLHQQSFTEFKKNVGDVKSTPTSRAIFGTEQSPEKIEAAKTQLSDFYATLPVTATVTVRSEVGDKARLVAFDCVPKERQPALGGGSKIVAPERPPNDEASEPAPRPASSPSKQKAEVPAPRMYVVHDSAANACPPGTVPIARTTLPEKLYLDAHAKPTFDHQLFAQIKGLDHASIAPPQSAFVHRYAHAAKATDNFGAASRLNIWSPHIVGSDMSLSQIWVVGTRVDGSGVQTVEAGWQVMSLWQSPYSTFFVYATADDYNATGCYATRCVDTGPQTEESFILFTNQIIIGRPISKQSTMDGNQELIDIKWLRNGESGSWWLKVDGVWVGYYPASFFGGGQLSKYGTYVDFGGETAGLTPTAEMGSGHHANEGIGKAAFQSRLRYYALDGSVKDAAAVQGMATNVGCYSIAVNAPAEPEPNAGTYIFFGGPGSGITMGPTPGPQPCS